MPGKAANVSVSERQWEVLSALRRSKSEPRCLVQRAAIIVLAWEGRLNPDIAQEVELEYSRHGTTTVIGNWEVKYFHQTLAHPFDWTYTGKPVAPRRRQEFCPPHQRQQGLAKVKLTKLSL